MWLKCDVANCDHTLSLRCAVCSQFKDKLILMSNYDPAFIEETTNLQTTMYKEHAATDMHAHMMGLFKKLMPVTSASMHQLGRLYCNRPLMMSHKNWRSEVWNSLHDCPEAIIQIILTTLINYNQIYIHIHGWTCISIILQLIWVVLLFIVQLCQVKFY